MYFFVFFLSFLSLSLSLPIFFSIFFYSFILYVKSHAFFCMHFILFIQNVLWCIYMLQYGRCSSRSNNIIQIDREKNGRPKEKKNPRNTIAGATYNKWCKTKFERFVSKLSVMNLLVFARSTSTLLIIWICLCMCVRSLYLISIQ